MTKVFLDRTNYLNRRVIIISLLGNCLELYDLGLCGFLIPIITPLFFPVENKFMLSLAGMSLFAIGFIMRPLGGLLFGYMGDVFGRKVSLSTTLLLMALATFVIAILPGYATIGIAAPFLFFICRMIQGICVGGEYNNAAIYLLESTSPRRRGFYSSLLTTSSNLGFAIASIMSIIVLSAPFEITWIWRVPFLFGAMVGLIGFYLRKKQVTESPAFERPRVRTESLMPVKKSLFTTFIIGWFSGALCLTLVGYFPSHLQLIARLSKQETTLIINICLITHMFLLPLLGIWSDKVGAKVLMRLSSVLILCLAYPIFYLISSSQFYLALLGGLIFIFSMSLYLAPMHAFTLTLFPPKLRCRGISLSFALGMGLLGGTAPIIATSSIQLFGFNEAPACYFILTAAVSLVSISLIKDPNEAYSYKTLTRQVTNNPF